MKPDSIILHHSATADSGTVSWQAIRRFHTSFRCDGNIIAPDEVAHMMAASRNVVRPWSDIGYHFGIERVNDGFEILMGRMPTATGAHCVDGGMNRRSLGVCFVGDFDRQAPPNEQWELGKKLVRAQMLIYGIPSSRVYGHREWAGWKSCPGRMFDLARFRGEL